MPQETLNHKYEAGDDIIFACDYEHLKIKKGTFGKITRKSYVYDVTSLVSVKLKENEEEFNCCAYRIRKIDGNIKVSNHRHRLTSIFK
jgi:phage gp45-like